MQVSVPRFDKIPWFSEASFMNKPLVLSLPKRYPHSSATFLVASKKDMNLPILFQVPDVLSKAGWNQNDPTLIRNKQLCSTCRDVKMVENVHYRLPILGPRTAVFHELLSDAYETLRETELSSLPRKEPVSKACLLLPPYPHGNHSHSKDLEEKSISQLLSKMKKIGGLGSSGNRQCCVLKPFVKFYLVFSDLAENQRKEKKLLFQQGPFSYKKCKNIFFQLKKER
ncbi:hypothetical protein MJG53_011082 [Ovis ammon polii x Ovis aries]|uniref:Uncharacterized protein n=1 Tax=Ovis ammon polii x Ovis aries TaxID=2918886 RepID=A0ACB9USI5_9CETA|nr:hypothetical protein MJG53_011082 [Ovis ammon polii x Ovis aries]